MFSNFSKILQRAIDTLFILHPERTSLGILSGIATDTLIEVVTPWISSHYNINNIPSIGPFKFSIIYILLFNLTLFFKRRKFPDDIETAVAYIKEAKKEGKISDIQARQMYINLFNKILQGVELNARMKREIKRWQK